LASSEVIFCGVGQKPVTAAQPVLRNPIFVLTAFLPSENYPLTRQIKALFSKLLCNFDPPGAFLVIAFISLAR
jgi:hypothetical protein